MSEFDNIKDRLDEHGKKIDWIRLDHGAAIVQNVKEHGEITARIATLEADSATLKKFMWLVIGLAFGEAVNIVLTVGILSKLK